MNRIEYTKAAVLSWSYEEGGALPKYSSNILAPYWHIRGVVFYSEIISKLKKDSRYVKSYYLAV